MKKISVFTGLFISLFILSCKSNNDKASKEDPSPTDKVAGVQTSSEINSPVGKWKMISWIDPGNQMTAAEKQHVLDVTEIEITPDGKYIWRTEGNPEPVVSTYLYYETTRELVLTSSKGEKQKQQISFKNGLMKLTDKNSYMELQRKN